MVYSSRLEVGDWLMVCGVLCPCHLFISEVRSLDSLVMVVGIVPLLLFRFNELVARTPIELWVLLNDPRFPSAAALYQPYEGDDKHHTDNCDNGYNVDGLEWKQTI